MSKEKKTDLTEIIAQLKRSKNLPQHIAIIMDGNGRWAKLHGLPRIAGHKEGVESVREIVEICGEVGVKYLTLYAFSTENWERPKVEVSILMRLLLNAIKNETDKLHKQNVKLFQIGEFFRLPSGIQKELQMGIEKTKNNLGLNLVLALSYSGKWDIVEATKKILQDVLQKKISLTDISELTFEKYLSTQNIPSPDVLIRTGGDMRVSNFLLWQIAYSEIVVVKSFWPEFRKKELCDAILEFQQRERRFGKISEQIKN